MDKSPVVYKRRKSGPPLSEVSWNIQDVLVDPDSRVSLLASDDAEGVENVTPAKKSRKKWSDQPLPTRRTRSSKALLEDTSLKGRASKWVGTLFGKKDKDKGKAVERTPPKKGKGVEGTPQKKGKSVVEKTPTPRKRQLTDKGSPMGVGGRVMYSPIEFVREKKAMFAEIDAFELESEEEDAKEDTAQHIAEALNSSEEEAVQQPTQPEQSTSSEDAGDREQAVRKDKGGDKAEAVNEEKAGDGDDR